MGLVLLDRYPPIVKPRSLVTGTVRPAGLGAGERRSSIRKVPNVEMTAWLSFDNRQHLIARAIDLSEGGLGICGLSPVPPRELEHDRIAHLVLYLGNGCLHCHVNIRNLQVGPHGYRTGMAFEDLQASQRELLLRVLDGLPRFDEIDAVSVG